MSEDDDHGGEMEELTTLPDFFDHIPSKHEKMEMRKANKTPSEWLRLLCKDWAAENEDLVEQSDSRFLEYKPFLKGMLSSQLLCRLSMQAAKDGLEAANPTHSAVDFWRILGIGDEFDKSYIAAQVERFCVLYNVRGVAGLDDDPVDAVVNMASNTFAHDLSATDPTSLAAAAAAGISVLPGTSAMVPTAIPNVETAAALAAGDMSILSKKQETEVSKAHRMAKDAAKALEQERRQYLKREQKRLFGERKERKLREKQAIAVRKATERASREAVREERRRKKLEIRMQREKFAQEQKEAALKRAAELVESNRVPLEIVRGPAAVKNNPSLSSPMPVSQPLLEFDPEARKKTRSAIVVSTAEDLNEIVTHSKNLWAKYNSIAKEHNQKVNWVTVAKELGIHVKVREKYARMHARAEQRGFDWVKHGDWKIKDHPEIFLEPTQAEKKPFKMPPPTFPDTSRTVLIGEGNKEVTDEAVAAAAAVVDASVTSPPVDAFVQTTEEHAEAAAAVAATLVSDPAACIKAEESYL